jgi:dihydrofolate synthase/folylpolyglutamate synthase
MSASPLDKALKTLYGLTTMGIKLGLDNTSRLLDHFGNPQLAIPTVHIAGTNGKGSTAAFTESILRASGKKVGLFTSPHLLKFNERIQINRCPISDSELVTLISKVQKAVDRLNVPVTFFEFCTVMAFLHFHENQTDWNVIEVGMGGRLDATNLCKVEASIITSIGMDHTQYLGNSLEQIAYEKACIIKDFGTVFAHVEDKGALNVVKHVARDRSAKVKLLGKDYQAEFKAVSSGGQTMDFSFGKFHMKAVEVPLIGRHQLLNAGLALAACHKLKGIKTNSTVFQKGLESTRWEGRMEVISRKPTLVLDSAHNPDGVRSLTQTLREYFSFERCFLVLGLMEDKAVDEMLELFSQFGDRFILVKPNQERAWDPKQLAKQMSVFNKPMDVIPDLSCALETVKKAANSNDLICITGSIFTVAEAKQFLANDLAG